MTPIPDKTMALGIPQTNRKRTDAAAMHPVLVTARLLEAPLLITPARCDALLTALRTQATDMTLALPPSPPPLCRAPSGIAVIPVYGTLVRRSLGLEAAFGLTAYGQILEQIEQALASPQVAGILLEIDSPGGEAGGVFELADFIRTASGHTPIWAHASDCACSAAYAIAYAAQRVTLSNTAAVGSIGVIALHLDRSAKDAQDGLHYTALYAGQHKTDGNPHAPLSSDARAALQAEVDRLYTLFVDHVARMRPIDGQSVRAMEAAVLFGSAAIDAGLADAVCTMDATLATFSSQLQAQGRLTPTTLHSAKPPTPIVYHATAQEPSMPSSPIASAQDATAPSTQTAPPIAADITVTQPCQPADTTADTEALTQRQDDALAIAEMCLLAGVPERTAEFLTSRVSAAQVRKVLLDARAQHVQITSRITAEASTDAANPLITAVKKMIGKE